MTAANKKILLMKPARDANQLQYTKAKDELAKEFQAKNAEFNGVVLQQTALIATVTETR